MIERVARAIFADYHRQGINHDDFDALLPSLQDSLRAVARAAIVAMREATPQMRVAVRQAGGVQALAYANAAWPTMIDAALKETA